MARPYLVTLISFFVIIIIFGDIVLSLDIDIDISIPGLCSEGNIFPHNESEGNDIHVITKCDAFYRSYVKYAGAFMECELKYSRPFRICEQCLSHHELAFTTYQALSMHGDLAECRAEYMKADRVQIIPSMQTYIQGIWSNAACSACAENVTVNPCTGKVNFTIPKAIVDFMKLFHNLSECMNTSLEAGNTKLYEYTVMDSKHNISICQYCLEEYNRLNDHYSSMCTDGDGKMCMDIVDRMNYTRLIWSHRFGCSCRYGESLPVIMIAVLIGILPLLFYGILRYKGKEKKTKIAKQKRLVSHSVTPLTQSLVESMPNASTHLTT